MRAKDIIGLGIALVLAIGVAFLTRFFLTKKEEPKQAVVAEQLQTTKILIASKELPEGAKVQVGDLVWQNWPLSSLNPSYVTETVLRANAMRAESLIGSVVRSTLQKGEPIVIKDFVKQGDRSVLAALLTPGKRAISIDVSPTTASSGLINPGDMVDVIVSFSSTSRSGEVVQQTIESKTFLKGIKVLAIDTNLSPPGKVNAAPHVATLEVTPAQAETLMATAKEGTLSLSLHGLATEDTTNIPIDVSSVPEKVLSKPEKKQITIIRGKDKSTVEFNENE